MSKPTLVKPGNHAFNVITPSRTPSYLTKNDKEMDKRATSAVQAALAKASICKKPVAKYDLETKKAYLEYPDGKKKYVE